MKIIFLDYDGVVNNLIFHTIDGEPDFYAEKSIDHQYRDYKVNDFQAVAWLNKISENLIAKLLLVLRGAAAMIIKNVYTMLDLKEKLLERRLN